MCVCVCVCTHTCVLSHSGLSDSATPWMVALQAPLAMEFSRQEDRGRLPFHTLGGLPDSGINCVFLASSALAAVLFTTVPPGKPVCVYTYVYICIHTQCIYVCVHMYTHNVYTYVYICMHAMYIRMCAYMYAHTQCIYICVHMYAHTQCSIIQLLKRRKFCHLQ